MDLAVLITVVLGTSASTLGTIKLLGDRISSLESSMNSRFSSVDTRLLAVESGLRDVGERLTVLETDRGKR